MPMSVYELRRQYRELGPVGFLQMVQHVTGLRTKAGIKPHNQDGVQVLESDTDRGFPRVKPESFSLRSLAFAIFGEDGWERGLRRPMAGEVMEAVSGDVLEAGNDIIPQQFADVTVYNEAAAGLFEVKILEGYNRPSFSLTNLVQTVPSLRRTEKFIGISTPADNAQDRLPGQRHPRMELQERYVTTPETQNKAQAVDVTMEAIKWDLTRQLMENAELVGMTIGLRKEYSIIDVALGIVNPYTYNGTAYYTYVNPADAAYWGNLYQNDITDWTALDLVERALSKMVDQETGQPIVVDAQDLVCMPGRKRILQHVLNTSQTRMARYAPSYSALGAWPEGTADVGSVGYSNNPVRGDWKDPVVSQYVYKRAIDNTAQGASGGPGLVYRANDQQTLSAFSSETIQTVGLNYADSIWLAGNFRKAFVYVENFPLTTVRAAPTSYEMADRGLVLSIFCDQMGAAGVLDPRFVVRCQGWPAATATW